MDESELPTVPNPPRCTSCGDDLQHVEMVPVSRVVREWDEGTLVIDAQDPTTHDEAGESEWIECRRCLRRHKLPEDWDYR